MNDDEQDERKKWQARQARRGRGLPKTCPTCKREGVLTDFEAAQRYQCADCTARDEGYPY